MDSSPLPPQQEPESKKLKMSITTSDDEGTATTTVTNPSTTNATSERKPKYKRRKIAIFFAYCGVGYQGMQKNPGAKTIEGELEEALFLSGAVPESERGKPKSFDWARSARTDKGVSAVGQVVSGRFYIDPPGFVDRLNSNLHDQIRIFGFKRVTPSFSAKKFCDRRRYVYLIPVFALDPNSHPARESVLASLGSENELAKCLECPERGRKVAGVMGRRNSESKMDEIDGIQSGVPLESALESNGVDKGVTESGVLEDSTLKPLTDSGEEKLDGNEENKEMPAVRKEFLYGDQEKEKFNSILKHYVGTHNFHNFTSRIKPEDPSAKRYILSFDANTVVTVEGIDFVKCEVVGQSFMLHQIRKMIGLAVAIMRGCAPESFIETALKQDVNITVPTAPEVGLYLDECFFSSYNQKWKDTHEEVSMTSFAEEAEDFKMKQVYSHIASTEHKEGAVAVWLHSLNCRNYPDFRFEESNGTCTNGGSENCKTNGETAQVDAVME